VGPRTRLEACPLSLVVDERSQLPEAPTRVLVAFAFANRRPATDVRQLFQHKRGLRVFGICHKLFRDPMIHPPAKLGLHPRQLLQSAFGGLGAGGLIGLAMSYAPLTCTLHLCPSARMVIGVHGQIDDTQIGTQKALRDHWRLFRRVNRHQQIERAIDQDQIGLPLRAMKLDSLIVAHLHRDNLTAMQGKNLEAEALRLVQA
jgi:hypothetical protein